MCFWSKQTAKEKLRAGRQASTSTLHSNNRLQEMSDVIHGTWYIPTPTVYAWLTFQFQTWKFDWEWTAGTMNCGSNSSSSWTRTSVWMCPNKERCLTYDAIHVRELHSSQLFNSYSQLLHCYLTSVLAFARISSFIHVPLSQDTVKLTCQYHCHKVHKLPSHSMSGHSQAALELLLYS